MKNLNEPKFMFISLKDQNNLAFQHMTKQYIAPFWGLCKLKLHCNFGMHFLCKLKFHRYTILTHRLQVKLHAKQPKRDFGLRFTSGLHSEIACQRHLKWNQQHHFWFLLDTGKLQHSTKENFLPYKPFCKTQKKKTQKIHEIWWFTRKTK